MSRMGSSTFWGKITVLIAVCGWGLSAQAKYSGGSGTQAEPLRISGVSDWQELMTTPADWASHFVLTADIDLDDVPITPIGSYSQRFTGVFDGNDYVIRNADVNMPGSDYVGLFGYLEMDAQIRNLGVEDASIFGRYHVGGLAGYNDGGSISNCYSTGSVSGTLHYVGGLVGETWHGRIINCYSTGSVSGDCYVGGLVGDNEGGTISNCYSSGSVSEAVYYVGGLVGYNSSGTISNCYSTGSVNGTGDSLGGLVGYHDGSISNCYSTADVNGVYLVGGLVGTNGYRECGWHCDELGHCWEECLEYSGYIYKCYSTGSVSGMGDDVGGLVGLHEAGEVADSFWDTETSDQSSSAAGTPRTTAEMKTQSTFTSAGWDFIEVWDIGENQTYPFLRMYVAGDINHDGVVDFRDIAYLAESWLRGL